MILIQILHCLFPLVLFEVFLCCWNISGQYGLVGLYWYVALVGLVAGVVESWAGGPGTFSCFNMGDRFSLVSLGFLGGYRAYLSGYVWLIDRTIVLQGLGYWRGWTWFHGQQIGTGSWNCGRDKFVNCSKVIGQHLLDWRFGILSYFEWLGIVNPPFSSSWDHDQNKIL